MGWRFGWAVVIWVGLLGWLFGGGTIPGASGAYAGPLGDRWATFPDWDTKPPVELAVGDLVYPHWFAGDWRVTTTLVERVAPLAPEVMTPGFEGTERLLGQPISYPVRFGPDRSRRGSVASGFQGLLKFGLPARRESELPIVADRVFNGLNLAQASLGDGVVLAVKGDPENPNRQVTTFAGDRQLISIVTGRGKEISTGSDGKGSDGETFLTTEVSQQIFQSPAQIYFNEVEATSRYQRVPSQANTELRGVNSPEPEIIGDQITAIYLSPQDPDYFKAREQPVALYRYRLEFFSLGQN